MCPVNQCVGSVAGAVMCTGIDVALVGSLILPRHRWSGRPEGRHPHKSQDTVDTNPCILRSTYQMWLAGQFFLVPREDK